MARLTAGNSAAVRMAHSSLTMEVIHNLLVALTVSAIALSLGAAFGVLSGRGAFAGMLSAGIIAFIAACLGGTRVQCSGPVAPMAAVMAVLFAAATTAFDKDASALGGITPDQYLNLICFICGGVLLLLAAFRTGFLISYVPSAVISGFMTGISLIIWQGQLQALFGWGGKSALSGELGLNIALVAGTIALIVLTPHMLRRILSPRLARLIPATLVAIVVMTCFSLLQKMNVETIAITASMPGLKELGQMVQQQIPDRLTWTAFSMALPHGVEFALICYLDTLMVSLIVDRMSGETTHKDKELMAQGVANTAIGLVGGIPGTQASIRSVLMVKEGATMRLAGVMVGVFVILEMILLLDFISMIPKAVFIGVLLKVGWDVCDREPIRQFLLGKENAPPPHIFWIIIGTAVVTVHSLTLAVAGFTAVYYIYRGIKRRRFKAKEPTHYVDARVKEAFVEEDEEGKETGKNIQGNKSKSSKAKSSKAKSSAAKNSKTKSSKTKG